MKGVDSRKSFASSNMHDTDGHIICVSNAALLRFGEMSDIVTVKQGLNEVYAVCGHQQFYICMHAGIADYGTFRNCLH